MKNYNRGKKKLYKLTFVTGFSFCSPLSQYELKGLIRKYPVTGYQEIHN